MVQVLSELGVARALDVAEPEAIALLAVVEDAPLPKRHVGAVLLDEAPGDEAAKKGDSFQRFGSAREPPWYWPPSGLALAEASHLKTERTSRQ